MNIVTRQIRNFLTGLMFLTQIPVPGIHGSGHAPLARATVWFPLIGGLVGVISGGVFYASLALVPGAAAAALALLTGIVVTGALHEDGLADTLDGLGGHTVAQRLEIMRDSRIGTYGALGLVGSFMLRWACLTALGPTEGFIALVVSHGVSRGMLPAILVAPRSVRTDGMSAELAGTVSPGEALTAAAIALTLAMIAGVGPGLIVFVAGLAGAGAMLVLVLWRFRGYTGDTLGAIQQASEITSLLALCALWA